MGTREGLRAAERLRSILLGLETVAMERGSMKRAILGLFLILVVSGAQACCTAWRAGAAGVKIADQEVLVVWDEEKGVEHFVRRARFESTQAPEDFGFLVPTPTQPKLNEVPNEIFEDLREIIEPEVKVEKRTRWNFQPLLSGSMVTASKSAEAASALGSLEILDQAVMGGFEVTVLQASEADSLVNWLKENGYGVRPEISEWVGPYVEKSWVITAFKFACDPVEARRAMARSSVCLSFSTPTPFFPYRVPSDVRVAPDEGNLLRVFFAGTERVFGEFEKGESKKWSAQTSFSGHDERMKGVLARVFGDSENESVLPEALWLTFFEDKTWPGGADDLFFKPSPDQNPKKPAPLIRAQMKMIYCPLDLVVLVALLVFYLVWRRFSHGDKTTSPSE
jgi:hypothetical protein